MEELKPDIKFLIDMIKSKRNPTIVYQGDTTRLDIELGLLVDATMKDLVDTLERSIKSQDRLATTQTYLTVVGVVIALFQLVGMFIIPWLQSFS